MVVEAPEQLKEAALKFFREEELPDALWWVDELTPLQLRLFAVELADALKRSTLSGDDSDIEVLIEDWEATAEVTASTQIVAAIERAKDPTGYRPLSNFTE